MSTALTESGPVPPPPREHEVDLLIVGAGPVGLYGAYYAGVRGLTVALVDSLELPGGQITAMYPEKPIFDVAGFPAVRGRDLVANLVEQAAQYDPLYLLGQQAQLLERRASADGSREAVVVTTDTGTRVVCGALVITGGIGSFTPRPLPAGATFAGTGLAYFVPRIADYAGSDVVIVGGGDSACDWALTLEPVARSVTLVHRREAFRAHAATVEAVRRSRVELITNAQVSAVTGDGVLHAVEVSGKGTPEPRSLPCQRMVVALGFLADIGPQREWGLDVRNNRHIVVDTRMSTGVPGVYAAGDIVDYDGKVRLISVGFGEVATAVNNAAHHLDPSTSVFPGHSSDAAPVPTAV